MNNCENVCVLAINIFQLKIENSKMLTFFCLSHNNDMNISHVCLCRYIARLVSLICRYRANSRIVLFPCKYSQTSDVCYVKDTLNCQLLVHYQNVLLLETYKWQDKRARVVNQNELVHDDKVKVAELKSLCHNILTFT